MSSDIARHGDGYQSCMARAIWSGSISFGFVSVPVKAFSAVRDHGAHFNQLEKGTGARINYKKVSDETAKVVTGDDIESAYELASGKYVVVEGAGKKKTAGRKSA